MKMQKYKLTHKLLMIGGRINNLRTCLKLKKQELATMVGVSPSMISRFENMENNRVDIPSVRILILLAKALETTTDYLLTGFEADKLDEFFIEYGKLDKRDKVTVSNLINDLRNRAT